jgi:hypothetical protein
VPQEAKRILSIVLPSLHPSFSTSFSATSPHRAAVGTGGGGGGTSHSPRTTCRNDLSFLSLSYVCPEPVLANVRFLCTLKMARKKDVTFPHRESAAVRR